MNSTVSKMLRGVHFEDGPILAMYRDRLVSDACFVRCRYIARIRAGNWFPVDTWSGRHADAGAWERQADARFKLSSRVDLALSRRIDRRAVSRTERLRERRRAVPTQRRTRMHSTRSRIRCRICPAARS